MSWPTHGGLQVCFAANCHASGLLTDMEYNIYTDFHTFVAENFDELYGNFDIALDRSRASRSSTPPSARPCDVICSLLSMRIDCCWRRLCNK